MSGHRIYGTFCHGVVLLLASAASGPASVMELASEVDAHIFFLKQSEGNAPIVDVVSNTRVKVLLPSKEKKVVKYSRVRWIEKKLEPKARVTICGTEGRSEYQTHASSDFISTIGESIFQFNIVADRSIENCYVALIYTYPDNPQSKGISFSKIGDLEAGKLESKEVFFPNVILPDGTAYDFEFYSGGYPLEMFYLPRVAGNPKSSSLLIPWKLRLEQYLEFARKKNLTRPAQPFEISFISLDSGEIKNRGIKSIKVSAYVKPDGTVTLIEGDPKLAQSEHECLLSDTELWRFFPAVKDGKPYEMKVSAPLRLR